MGKKQYRVDGHLDSSSESEEEESENSSSSSSESEKEEEKEESIKSSSDSSTKEGLEPEDKELCSDDDLHEKDTDCFDSENIIMCQYDVVKKGKKKNTWVIKLCNGVMNVRNRDYIFTKATGEATW